MGEAAKNVEGIRRYQRIIWTKGMDNRIREHYRAPDRHSTASRRHGGVKRMAREWGIDRANISRRAVELGVLQCSRYWTEPEIEIVHECADLPASKVAERLASAGYKRTTVAVTVLRKRLHIRPLDKGVMTGHQVASLLGVDPTTVSRWLRLGWLKATRAGTDRTAAQRGDHWHVTSPALARFVIDHPTRVDLTKVTDAVWFIDLIARRGKS